MNAVEVPHCPKQPRRMRTLGDAVASIAFECNQLPPEERSKHGRADYTIRVAARAASVVLDATDDWARIPLEDLMGLDSKLIDLALNNGLDRRHANCYATAVGKILAHAVARGWTCSQMKVIESWELPTAALHGQTLGCLQIIEYLISKRKTPATTREKDLENWCQLAEARGLETFTTEQYLMHFRGKMRAAKLKKQFFHLDLRSKRPERYSDALEDMAPQVQQELEQIAKSKLAVWTPGRSARLATRAPSIRRMYYTVRQMHGHRTKKRKKKPVAGLIYLFTPSNINPFIDFLEHKRGLLRDGVGCVMAPVQALVRHHPMFKGKNYDWISTRIQKVPKERHYKLLMRKEAKAQPYELLGDIPKALRRESQTPGLSEFDVAWCRHDEAVISVLHELVLRQKNIRSSRTNPSVKPNLVWKKLTPEMLLDLFIPDCVNLAYQDDKKREFLMFSFDESETKGRRSELVVMTLALASLLKEYKDNYRGAIVPEKLDHGQLFANRRGGELSQDTFYGLVCRLTKKHIRRKVSPHIWRDIFAAHIKMLAALGRGGGREQIRRRLFHVDDEMTDHYSQLDYTAPGIAALDREYLSAA